MPHGPHEASKKYFRIYSKAGVYMLQTIIVETETDYFNSKWVESLPYTEKTKQNKKLLGYFIRS